MTKLSEDWEEIPEWPGYYVLKAYTAKQIEMLNRRPTELINKALKNVQPGPKLPSPHRGTT